MELLSLSIALLSDDRQLRREIGTMCEQRGHRLLDASRLRDLRHLPLPDVVVVDSPRGLDDAAETALAIRSVGPDVAIAVVADAPVPSRSVRGVRVIDRWRTGERIGDELELAWIGIPASVAALGI